MASRRQKALAKRTRRKVGATRQPDGRTRPDRPSISVAAYRREVLAASLISAAPLLGTQLGWLAMSRQITQEHLEAGLRLAETYGRYDLAMGCRRADRSLASRAPGRIPYLGRPAARNPTRVAHPVAPDHPGAS
jgi:hypothetical protein